MYQYPCYDEDGDCIVSERICFLCDTPAKLLPNDNAYSQVKCPNCGRYKLWDMADRTPSYQRTRHIVAGEVFAAWYYERKVKDITGNDFETTRTITTPEKLYRLAKYIFTEERKNEEWNPEQDIPCRPASCYARDDKGWYKLLDDLKRLQVVEFCKPINERFPNDPIPVFQIKNIKMAFDGKIAFEKGIDSPEKFEEAFMNTSKTGNIIIKDSTLIGSPIQTGNGNTVTNTTTTTITADIIREKLKEKGIPEAQITAIESQITELTAELTKETVDKGKLQEIFLKIKEVGGVFLVSAFAFLSKPEAAEVINNIVNNVKNLLGG